MEWYHTQYAEALYVASGGRIQMTAYQGGQLIPTADILDSVSQGIIQIGVSTPAYDVAKIDIGNLLMGMPYAWQLDDYDQLQYMSGMTEIAREAYAEIGVHLLSLYAGGPYQMLSTKKVTSLAELRKIKVRTTSGTAQLLKNLGVKTTFVPYEEIYTNLATGVVDAVISGGLADYLMTNWAEVAKYYYPQGFLSQLFCHVYINKKLWDSLPRDLQAIVQLVTARQAVQWKVWNQAANDIAATKLKVKFNAEPVYFPESDIKTFQKEAVKMLDEDAKKSERCAKLVKIIKDYVGESKYTEAVTKTVMGGKYFPYNYPLYQKSNYKK
jgi:TRAP-type C4-dicarboxylate transport system substrate-binding protein